VHQKEIFRFRESPATILSKPSKFQFGDVKNTKNCSGYTY